eukprot:182776-Alexandrium_andersonii.AAC.1
MRRCTSPSRLRCTSQGRAPSFGAAFTALVPLRPAGGRCALRVSRASGSPRAKPVRVAYATPSWT